MILASSTKEQYQQRADACEGTLQSFDEPDSPRSGGANCAMGRNGTRLYPRQMSDGMLR